MAHNASSHNSTATPTGPTGRHPPAPSKESKEAILNAANGDPTGQSAPGRDGGDKNAGAKVKSEKELEKERQKAEKLKKFEAKKAKQQQPNGTPAAPKQKEKKKTDIEEVSSEKYVEETPVGEKKILKPLEGPHRNAYVPGVVESAWYAWWEKQEYFKPAFGPDGHLKPKGNFVISIPPPNVTGALHCGHALATSLQDTMIRWYRMRGYTALYVPGCDHAGIATQTVVEKKLKRLENKSRHDLGRAKFIETVHEWKEEYHQKINRVLARLGGSMDWTREAFTMDENLSAAVTETFVQLHDEGYIYRANRLVNWCPELRTALSNLEVDNVEITGRKLMDVPGYDGKKIEFGVLVFFKYPIEGTSETIEVATTRPETMLGDTGIAVHPKDERYKHLVGKNARHPIIKDRLLPVIADDYVDMEFGTGAVKLTPAHDPNDFNLGQKHKLQFINIMNDDGSLNENTGPHQGEQRFVARYTVVEKLQELGLFVKKEDNPMKIPICSRSKDVVEPLLKPQWWVRMRELADPAVEAVRNGDIKIQPETAEKNYFAWLKIVNDWCISRQLWWGHQIPAYMVKLEGQEVDPNNEQWVTGRSEQEAQQKAEKQFPGKKFTLHRDPDVLDTWFSSGLWPFSTLGWPKQTEDFKNFFPTTILETGWDILFFWVARMIFLSLKLTGQVPFREVYCHSLIRDSEGRKMSKSLGNVIDPVDVMDGISLEALHAKLREGNLDPKEVKNAEKYQNSAFPQGIPECGADALRFSLVQYTTGGGDINFDIKVMHSIRRFCNKMYQATKYVLGNLGDDFVPNNKPGPTGRESLAEKWILHKMTVAARDVNKALEEREFSRSTQLVRKYWYDQLCDVYIENSKSIIQNGTPEEQRSALDTLYDSLEGALTMIHPYMPFLTEELWQRLPRRKGDKTPSIMVAEYPEFNENLFDPEAEAAYELVLGCSKGIRSLLGEYSIKERGEACVLALDETSFKSATAEKAAIQTLSGKALSSLKILGPKDSKPAGSLPFSVSAHATVFVKVKGRIDVSQEIPKVQEKLKKANAEVLKQKKAVEESTGKASEAILEELQEKLRDDEARVHALHEATEQLHRLKIEA